MLMLSHLFNRSFHEVINAFFDPRFYNKMVYLPNPEDLLPADIYNNPKYPADFQGASAPSTAL
jgi:hypothetical protein